jgi:DNA primase
MNMKVLASRGMRLGVKATIAIFNNGDEVHRDEVNLWNKKSREQFIDGYIAASNADLNRQQKGEVHKKIDTDLRALESQIKAKLKEAKMQANEGTGTGEVPPMTKEERAEAEGLLKDPALLARTQKDLSDMGIVAEEDNKVLIYLIATSRKMRNPLGATIKASSSAGKNNLIGKAASLMPPEEVRDLSYMSAKALIHAPSDWAKHKLLMITEIVGKEQAEYLIRVFQSEGKVRSAVTVREYEGGPFKVEEKEVEGPAAYLDTTTKHDTHPENATRVFEIYLDESEGQTKAITRQQAREAGTEKFRIEAEREKIKKIHRNAQRLLKPGLDVIVPYAELIDFPAEHVRGRRDFPKLLSLIQVIAFLHQYQRKVNTIGDQEYIEAQLVDYALAYSLVKQTFTDTMDDLDKRSRHVFDKVAERVKDGDVFTRDYVAEACGKRKNKLIEVFRELEEKEYFLDADGNPIPSRLAGKREYTLNLEDGNGKSVIEKLTTPDDVEKKWQAAQMQNQNGKAEPQSHLYQQSQAQKEVA